MKIGQRVTFKCIMLTKYNIASMLALNKNYIAYQEGFKNFIYRKTNDYEAIVYSKMLINNEDLILVKVVFDSTVVVFIVPLVFLDEVKKVKYADGVPVHRLPDIIAFNLAKGRTTVCYLTDVKRCASSEVHSGDTFDAAVGFSIAYYKANEVTDRNFLPKLLDEFGSGITAIVKEKLFRTFDLSLSQLRKLYKALSDGVTKDVIINTSGGEHTIKVVFK